jgi:hypothetical protein
MHEDDVEPAVTPARVVEEEHVDEEAVGHAPVRRWYEYDLAGRINSVLFAVLFALEALLATRFLLLLFGANPNTGFVDFIYDLSWPFVRPFSDAFTDRTWDEGIVEVNTLLAMGVWFVAFMIIAMLVNAIVPRDTDVVGDGGHVRRRRFTRYQP